MQQTTTPDTLRNKLVSALKRDLQNAKQYLKICRDYIQQAQQEQDEETLYFWANQQDIAAQQVQAINYQLKTI